MTRRLPEGIFVRHARGCASAAGAPCDCRPTYEASAYVSRDGKRVWRRFPTLAAAKAWRADSVSLASRGALRAGATPTLSIAAEQLLDGMRDGSVRARGGGRFRASVIREYGGALRRHVLPALGTRKLADIAHADLLDLVDELHGKGLAPSTIRNTLDPVRVILRRAVARGQLGANPAAGLELPTGETPRDRVADAAEAAAVVAALPRPDDRTLWACALYAGLRSGELRALRWRHVRLGAGMLDVRESMDDRGALTPPKTRRGIRSVPITPPLHDALAALRATTRDAPPDAFVLGSSATTPFTPTAIYKRARRAWREAALAPIGLHEARHSCASMWIAAGVNIKAVSQYLGHASISITLDRYGHLLPGSDDEARRLVSAYLERADTAGRLRQLSDGA